MQYFLHELIISLKTQDFTLLLIEISWNDFRFEIISDRRTTNSKLLLGSTAT